MWCDVCKKRKLGENTGNRGCKKRTECREAKTDTSARARSSSQDSNLEPPKRKPEKSPDKKSKSKKSHIAGGSEADDDLGSASEADVFA